MMKPAATMATAQAEQEYAQHESAQEIAIKNHSRTWYLVKPLGRYSAKVKEEYDEFNKRNVGDVRRVMLILITVQEIALCLGLGIPYLSGSETAKASRPSLNVWMLINMVVYLISGLFYGFLTIKACGDSGSDLTSLFPAEIVIHVLKVVLAFWALIELTNSDNWDYVSAYDWKKNNFAVSYEEESTIGLMKAATLIRLIFVIVMTLMACFFLPCTKKVFNLVFPCNAELEYKEMKSCDKCFDDFEEKDPRQIMQLNCFNQHVVHQTCYDRQKFQDTRRCTVCYD